MSILFRITSKPHLEVSKDRIRRLKRDLLEAEEAIPIPPSVLPPTPPTPPPSSQTPGLKSDSLTLQTPTTNNRASGGFSATPNSKFLCSTPLPTSNERGTQTSKLWRSSRFPKLIPSELTLGIVRESPLTVVEELTCGDHGKEVGNSRSTLATIAERQCLAYGTSRQTLGVACPTVEMGACTSKKSSSSSSKQTPEQLSQTAKSEKPAKSQNDDADDNIDEEDPAPIPKFKLKRDSIAVTKVRMMKTQVHQQTTIGEEEEDDEDDQNVDSRRRDDHVHFDNNVSKQSIPNDSGVSLNSCPENDHDSSLIKFNGKLDYDSVEEVFLASNVSIRSLRKEKVVENEERSFDFEALREKTKRLIECRTKPFSERSRLDSPRKLHRTVL